MGYTRVDELSEEKRKEFKKLAMVYIRAVQSLEQYFEENNLDSDKGWGKANQLFDEHLRKN